jgi:hypothetical protein
VGISRDVYTTYFIDIGDLIQTGSQASKLKMSINELQLESTSLKIQTMVAVDASTDSAHGKVIRCNFKNILIILIIKGAHA